MKRHIFILLIFFSCSTNSDEITPPELPDPYVAVKFASFQYSLGGVYGSLAIYTHKDYMLILQLKVWKTLILKLSIT